MFKCVTDDLSSVTLFLNDCNIDKKQSITNVALAFS